MDLSEVNLGELGRQIFCKLIQATASESTYEDKIEEVRLEKKIYNDDSFPPTQSSLIKDWKDPECRDKARSWKSF